MSKYIFVTGGVVSGLGKGIVAASLGRLLKSAGYSVYVEKFDPYMNIDPGTLNPTQHGEVFVTKDGAETDLDLGHYERFIGENLSKSSSLTSGKLFQSVLNKERNGDYQGKTVQIIPHVTNEIKDHILQTAKESGADILITEIGGTVGDIESQPYLEALRQFSLDVGRENCAFIHVCLLLYMSCSDEFKSKPVQHSVRELQRFGIFPDVVVTRSDKKPPEEIIKKISLFCSIDENAVVPSTTVKCLYDAPIMLHKNGLYTAVSKALSLDNKCNLTEWKKKVATMKITSDKVKIAIVGKYVSLRDSYISLVEAIKHAGGANLVGIDLKWIDSETITDKSVAKTLKDVDGIIIPGGFGSRGVEGMITTCKYAREHKIPYLGICLGMQVTVIEYARHMLGIADATSGEFSESGNHVIDILPDKKGKKIGGTMRLGAYPCTLKDGTVIHEAYGKDEIEERHRHRYEFNSDYLKAFEDGGLVISGKSPDGRIVETVEVSNHPFFVGVQFHPEFTSRPDAPSPIFSAFIKAAKETRDTKR